VPEYGFLAGAAASRGHRVIGYGLKGKEIRVRDVTSLPQGQRLELSVLGRETVVELPLAGRFQAWNALCALGMAMGAGADPVAATECLERLEGVRGRLERVAETQDGAAVYVDYAHTPDALETILNALRPHVQGRLVAVFGCGGDRDRGKRPVMGGIAARLADKAVVTDDNPRTEVPEAIRAEVMAGCPGGVEIGDRARAIREAVRDLRAGDVLVIAGKGHEQGQIVGTEVRPFDDAEEARKAVEELGR
jgi:UDP-N-acetylmuramoyl-L-alanyl-D-glutamate--2,6-diaminopimelate ligase